MDSNGNHVNSTAISGQHAIPCTCDLIAKARADERKKAAQLVAALPTSESWSEYDDDQFNNGVTQGREIFKEEAIKVILAADARWDGEQK